MKKRSRILLFLAVAAITFAGMNRFIGPRHGYGYCRDHRGCSPEKQQPEEKQTTPATGI